MNKTDFINELLKSGYIEYHGYYINETGNIYNKYGRKLSPYKSKSGTWVVALRKEKGKRYLPSVNRLLYQAFHKDIDLKNYRVISALNNDYEIEKGISNKPVFNLYDLKLCKTVQGGKRKPKRNYILDELEKWLESTKNEQITLYMGGRSNKKTIGTIRFQTFNEVIEKIKELKGDSNE